MVKSVTMDCPGSCLDVVMQGRPLCCPFVQMCMRHSGWDGICNRDAIVKCMKQFGELMWAAHNINAFKYDNVFQLRC